VYVVLITVAVAAISGRILNVENVYEPRIYREDPGRMAAAIALPLGAGNAVETLTLSAASANIWTRADPSNPSRVWPVDRPEPMPTFGSNDRSRWDTARALVDHGTYAIGRRETDPDTGAYRDSGIVMQDGWQTIDKVLKPEPEGNDRSFYSSKPPLLATLLAGEYWLLKHLLGWSVVDQRWQVVRVGLFTWNVLPLVIYLVFLARLIERWGVTEWARLYVFAAACFGTYLTPFALTINNHSVATCTALFALYAGLACMPVPEAPPSTWRSYAVAGFFAAFTACTEMPAASFAVALFVILLLVAPRPTLLFFLPAALVPVAAFFATNYLALGQFTPVQAKFDSPWYEYPGSHWLKPAPGEVKHGIDWAGLHESRAAYAFNLLLGHHGLFSLTPINFLALAGMVVAAAHFLRRPWPIAGPRQPTTDNGPQPDHMLVGALGLVLTLVVVGFYLVKTTNYGGWTSGPRWLFWLTPFWLLAMLPVADWLAGRRWGRALAYALLAVTVLSVSYPAWNPWRHPWIYNWMEWQGLVRY
jgi:hypothetical protein